MNRRQHPHHSFDPTSPHHSLDPQDPHISFDPQDRPISLDPRDPHISFGAQGRDISLSPQDPYRSLYPEDSWCNILLQENSEFERLSIIYELTTQPIWYYNSDWPLNSGLIVNITWFWYLQSVIEFCQNSIDVFEFSAEFWIAFDCMRIS